MTIVFYLKMVVSLKHMDVVGMTWIDWLVNLTTGI